MAPRRPNPSFTVLLATILAAFQARFEGGAFSILPRRVRGQERCRCHRPHGFGTILAHPAAAPAPTVASDPAPHHDGRPHEQRAAGPRPARRMNQGFRYLYRQAADDYANTSAAEFLLAEGFSWDQIRQMNASFPPLLTLSVPRHLLPKMRFLRDTLGVDRAELPHLVPAHYFGARLEAAVAPRHAYLAHRGLPHGRGLLQRIGDGDGTVSNATLLSEFLSACRNAKRFAALCRSWQRRYGAAAPLPGPGCEDAPVSPKQIEAFDAVFARGLMSAARNEQQRGTPGLSSGSPWHADHIDIGSAALIRLLVRHGANPRERDRRGVSLLHWAAGTGNRDGLEALLPHVDPGADAGGTADRFTHGVWTRAERDGATLLHWAVAGGNARCFGTGGHVDVVEFLLTHVNDQDRKRYIDQRTKDGNSALMWAAWSGSLGCVQLLLQHGADTDGLNRNGCTLAHWATSGGHLEVCKYLYDNTNISFTTPNNGGHTPLTHAVAFGRADVVKWLRDEVIGESFTDDKALRLAHDFVTWKSEDEGRRQVLRTFLSWESSVASNGTDDAAWDLRLK